MAYHILLIDDSAVVRKVFIKTFGMTSIHVGEFFEASNGREGLALLRKHWIDLVFLDVNMPVMDGITFVREVRSDPDLKNTRIVVVSTEGSNDRRQELEELGIEDYLRKPATPEALAHTITKILGELINE